MAHFFIDIHMNLLYTSRDYVILLCLKSCKLLLYNLGYKKKRSGQGRDFCMTEKEMRA